MEGKGRAGKQRTAVRDRNRDRDARTRTSTLDLDLPYGSERRGASLSIVPKWDVALYFVSPEYRRLEASCTRGVLDKQRGKDRLGGGRTPVQVSILPTCNV